MLDDLKRKQERDHRGVMIHWTARVLMVLISTIVGGIVSVQVAKIKADAGYTTLVKSMEETQSTLKTLTEKVYFMEGELTALKDERKGLQPLTALPPVRPAHPHEFKPLPANLDSAYMQIIEQRPQAPAAK
jgi:hypothetical protein